VADPEYTEANQVYLQMKLGTFTGIAGRQRVILDNARFIGNVGWRQSEQTYDAVTFKSAALPKTQLHYSCIANVNRVTGPDEGSQPANYHGPNHALNGNAELGAFGAVTGFACLLDFQNAARDTACLPGLGRQVPDDSARRRTSSAPKKINCEAMLKFADNQADGFATDTTKAWLQLSATF